MERLARDTIRWLDWRHCDINLIRRLLRQQISTSTIPWTTILVGNPSQTRQTCGRHSQSSLRPRQLIFTVMVWRRWTYLSKNYYMPMFINLKTNSVSNLLYTFFLINQNRQGLFWLTCTNDFIFSSTEKKTYRCKYISMWIMIIADCKFDLAFWYMMSDFISVHWINHSTLLLTWSLIPVLHTQNKYFCS